MRSSVIMCCKYLEFDFHGNLKKRALTDVCTRCVMFIRSKIRFMNTSHLTHFFKVCNFLTRFTILDPEKMKTESVTPTNETQTNDQKILQKERIAVQT